MKIALLVTALVAVSFAAIAPPVWPAQYYASGVFSIPYFEIVEPIEIYYDGVNNRELLSYYNGMDTYLWRFDIQTLFQVIPRIDKMMCFNSTGIGNGPLTTLLPDLSDWIYRGNEKKHGAQCNVWEQIVTNFNKTATYKMYVNAANNYPVELHLNGYDFVFGSHPDVYIMTFKQYKPNFNDADVFNAPAICSESTEPASHNSVLRARALLGRVGGMVPPKQLDNEFDLFVHAHKKVYSDVEEYTYRKSVYQNNVEYINNFNSQNKGHKLAVNHLADLTQEEIQAMLYPKTQIKRSEVPSNADYIHAHSGRTAPAQINWVDLGAVTPVKDQGVCGSCWTFGTTGSIEGAYFMKTGNLVSLSEQQIVDCAWGPWIQGNSGCDGGFAGPAYEWIMQNGGIALENTYKYLMMDHWCNAFDVSSGVTLTGYVNVTSGSENDLLDAVATVGPVTVAIDASHPSLTFYTSGVYYEPTCGNTPDDLDHQVLVVGYGTENGQDYWLVKNSWSTHWGDQGFVKMSRNRGNNCGIATQAQYPLV